MSATLGLRGPHARWTQVLDGGPPRVVDVDPECGATSVLRDNPVVVRLSHPVDPATLAAGSLRVTVGADDVPGRLVVSPDRTMVLWIAKDLLVPHVEHVVHLDGLRDLWGTTIESHTSRFVPGELSAQDWREEWEYDGDA